MEKQIKLNAIKLFCAALVCTSFIQVKDASAQQSCAKLFSTQIEKDQGPAFLLSLNPNLHNSPPVQAAMEQIKKTTGTSLVKPADRISAWLKQMETATPEYNRQIIKHYRDRSLTKRNEVTQAFFDFQQRILREQGHGTHVYSEDEKAELLDIHLSDQKNSLDRWLNYLFTSNTQDYPMWAKYWGINSIVNLGKFNPENGKFASRSKGQVSPFPELNSEAFAMVVDAMTKKINGRSLEQIKDPELLKQLETRSFEKLYGRALQILAKKVVANSVQGKWVIYKQGSDPRPLVKSLEGMCTGWCTAGEGTAQSQLQNGDFHIFYSLDDAGVPRIPRVAIRMEGANIGEIRGVAANQNLDSAISASSVLKDKLQEFGSKGTAYYKKVNDMKRLTTIEQLVQRKEEISIEDLEFLYEINDSVQGFGQSRDPRIDEIKEKRDQKMDIAKVTGFSPDKISTTTAQAITGKYKCHLGYLDLSGIDSKQIKGLPDIILGSFEMSQKYLVKDFKFPKKILGNFNIIFVESAIDAVFPEFVTGHVSMHLLERAGDTVVFPKHVGGGFVANNLKAANVVIYPENLQGNLFVGLENVKKVVLPKHIGGSLRMPRLKTAETIVWPDVVERPIELTKEIERLVPEHLRSALP